MTSDKEESQVEKQPRPAWDRVPFWRRREAIVAITAVALITLFIIQAGRLDTTTASLPFVVDDGQVLTGRSNLVIQTIFYAISIVIGGGTLLYILRKKG